MSFKTLGFVFAGIGLVAACSSSNGNGNGSDDTGTGPAADLKCSSSGKNAFDTYGAAAFVAVNQAIFANVTNELAGSGSANLGTSFQNIGTDGVPALGDPLSIFEGKLAAFLVWVYGGPDSITYTDGSDYTGDDQDMTTAHTGLAITSSQFTYFVTDIVVPALTSSGVSSADVSSCFAPAITSAAFEAEIVGL